MTLALGVIAYGVYGACLLAVGAVGFSLQFGVTNVLNLAYGALLTSAMFVDYAVGRGSPNIWLGLAVGIVWGGLSSVAFARLIVMPYMRRGTSLIGMAIVTIGMAFMIQYGLEAIQGSFIYSFGSGARREFTFEGVTMSELQITIIGTALALMVLVHALLAHTRLGLAMRATANDPGLARSCGIATENVRLAAWGLSGALCGIAGVMFGLSSGSFGSTSGLSFFITLVVAAVVGGVGKPYGAMLGALIIGLVSAAAAAIITPSYKDVVAWVILIVVLVIRPRGIFGEFASKRELVG